MKILIVDDDPLTGEVAAAILEDAGHECRLVGNGLEALETLNGSETFDRVVSDMHMPLLNGLQLLQEIRALGIDIPFILLSGDEPASLQSQAPDARVVAYLVKDASLEQTLPQSIHRS